MSASLPQALSPACNGTSLVPKMRVGFNARLLYAPALRGWNRYTVNLVRELLSLKVEVVLFSDQAIHESHLAKLSPHNCEIRVSPPMNYFHWEQIWLPKECAVAGVDVLHCPFHFGLPFRSPCPRVLTLHDAIDQIYYGRRIPALKRLRLNSLKMNLLLWIARAKAEQIITVSEHARQDLIQQLRIPPHRISVIYEAADPNFERPVCLADRKRICAKYEIGCPYIFYVGGWEQRKNILFLLAAFAHAGLHDVHLVLAGGTRDQIAILAQKAHALGVGPRVHLLGWVPDCDLPALYAEALCFVYPSEYEGFGMQICEAMAMGCAVLAARASSLPEILGTGGQTFGLDTTFELVTLLRALTRYPENRVFLQKKAQARVREFSWKTTAEKTLRVYREVAARA
ncbi:MAG TPA: glycosyltransferase family 1 protein [Candidatus Saccharimonadales bacterium]|jgi:glycosyltransferase involved in cell wall biosynthesis|nr:glycosyltransferase family 1 protein [Candidatus Saccharimonadales bacterium]